LYHNIWRAGQEKIFQKQEEIHRPVIISRSTHTMSQWLVNLPRGPFGVVLSYSSTHWGFDDISKLLDVIGIVDQRLLIDSFMSTARRLRTYCEMRRTILISSNAGSTQHMDLNERVAEEKLRYGFSVDHEVYAWFEASFSDMAKGDQGKLIYTSTQR